MSNSTKKQIYNIHNIHKKNPYEQNKKKIKTNIKLSNKVSNNKKKTTNSEGS